MRVRGVDLRTIRLHFECVKGGALDPEEDAAILDGHRSAEPVRHDREKAKDQAAANEVRRRRRR